MTIPTSHVERHSLLQMTLHTEIAINASPAKIWSILTDFAGYEHWNRSMPLARGKAQAGTWLDVEIHWPGLKRSPYRLEVLAAIPDRELRWLGHLGRTGMMDGDHRFIIEPVPGGASSVVQTEHFSGWLVPFFAPWLRRNVLSGFEQMNVALKDRAEGCSPPAVQVG